MPACGGIGGKAAFSLLELLVVIIIIGILSALAYANLMELIFTNRARETAQTMRTFVERALAEGKRQDKPVTITLSGNNITYTINSQTVSEPLSGGFVGASDVPKKDCESNLTKSFNGGITPEPRIGISGIDEDGYFVACDPKGYCGAAVKVKSKNSFVACIKRAKPPKWEAL
ncbi:MAG: prepilin-type N-terminal cleavage/methylation domain-containing protein [Candidatus Fibromonas sp.]|jgi:prepilin-type N-terminal cleavage/methylation domain-containing protein|nr:prepilin-type N-terminal cleavage/methylation domain-containing protein [Candidatus Fibromonas sp.]